MSNIATLTRLGLSVRRCGCFLRALRWEHPELRPVVPEGLLGRYLKEEDEATHYEDAHTGEGRRRLYASPALAVPLPSEAGPACGGLLPQGEPGEVNIERRRRAEATEEWRKRYDIRAGIEGNELRAEARPLGLGACGCEGAVGCGLPST